MRRAGLTLAVLAAVALLVAALAIPSLREASSDALDQPPAPAPPDTTVSVGWRPATPTQGSLVRIRVEATPPRALLGVSGTAGGEELWFYGLEDGGFESLAPIPVDAGDTLVANLEVRTTVGAILERPLRIPVAGGSFRHEELSVAPELGSPLSEENRARLARDQARARAVSEAAMRTPRLWRDRAALPRDARVTSDFGNGRIFNGQVSSRHMGLDLDGEPGDTVRATARGVVGLVDSFLLAGEIVYLNHGAGLLSAYFHLSEQLVAEGDTVDVGDPLGLVGATGRVTGPHLHWVVRYGTTSVDPRSLLAVVGEPPRPDSVPGRPGAD